MKPNAKRPDRLLSRFRTDLYYKAGTGGLRTRCILTRR